MPDAVTVASILLVAGPLLGILGFYDRALWPIWTAPRDVHLVLVGAHGRGWTMVNVGFAIATVLTASGLVILAGSLRVADGYRAALTAVAVAYAIGGALWCAVLAIRARTTPRLAVLVAAGETTEPAESLVGGAIGGLFSMFALVTAVALVALGLLLAAGGGVALPVAGFAVVVGSIATAVLLRTGDLIPAALYLPTLVLGIALLVGWT